MLLIKSRGKAPPEADKLEPDRIGSLRGLSLTGYHHVAYVEWGPKNGSVPVVCVHGLTRQGRDFDFLGHELAAAGRRVVCPDLAGRGRSGRLRNADEYALPQYDILAVYPQQRNLPAKVRAHTAQA